MSKCAGRIAQTRVCAFLAEMSSNCSKACLGCSLLLLLLLSAAAAAAALCCCCCSCSLLLLLSAAVALCCCWCSLLLLLLLLSAAAAPWLGMPNFERCWGWCCCKLRLVSGSCHVLGPNADFALLCSDGLPLKPPVLRGPFSFSASFFCGFVCCAGTLLSHQLAVTLLSPQKGDRPKWFFYFTFIFSGGVSSHLAILEGICAVLCSVVGTSFSRRSRNIEGEEGKGKEEKEK